MSGQVLWAPAGPADAIQRLQPYFDAMGRGTMQIGPEAYMASVMKLSGNFFIAATIETIAEGMTLAEKNGVSRYVRLDQKGIGIAPCCAHRTGRHQFLQQLMSCQDLDMKHVQRIQHQNSSYLVFK